MGRWGIRGQTERFLVSFARLVLLRMNGDFQNGGNFPSVPSFRQHPVASGEVTCAVQVGYSKPAYAKSAYAAPKIVSGFIVCATRPHPFANGAKGWATPEASFSAFTFSAPLQPRTNFPPTGSLTLEATGESTDSRRHHEETTLPRRRRPVRSGGRPGWQQIPTGHDHLRKFRGLRLQDGEENDRRGPLPGIRRPLHPPRLPHPANEARRRRHHSHPCLG